MADTDTPVVVVGLESSEMSDASELSDEQDEREEREEQEEAGNMSSDCVSIGGNSSAPEELPSENVKSIEFQRSDVRTDSHSVFLPFFFCSCRRAGGSRTIGRSSSTPPSKRRYGL